MNVLDSDVSVFTKMEMPVFRSSEYTAANVDLECKVFKRIFLNS